MTSESEGLFTVVNVDGEDLFFPSAAGWESIRRDHSFRGWCLGAEEFLWQWIDQFSKNPELHLGLGKVGKAFDVWRPYLIVYRDTKPIRIHPVIAACPNCDWKGTCGTTAEPDLFMSFGSHDFQSKYAAAQAIPPAECPRCTQAMPDHIVWCDQTTM
jgi:hypothetical protein